MKPYIAVAFTILLLTGGAACNLQTIAGNSPGSKVPEIKDTAVLTLNEEATCLSGPGQGFDEVGMLSAGQVAEALGKSPEGDYWVIQYPAEPATLCWVANASVVVSGNPQIVPVATPPATPTLPNSPEAGCPSPVPSGPTPVSCGAPPSGSGCPSPVPSGPTPVYCGPDLGSGCPPAYTGGPTLVSCPTTVP